MSICVVSNSLEPDEVKASRPVLRGEGVSNDPDLPDIPTGSCNARYAVFIGCRPARLSVRYPARDSKIPIPITTASEIKNGSRE